MSTILSMPSNAFVDFKRVKANITIAQVVERYDLTQTFTRSGDRLSGPCPLHRGSNPTQFRVSLSKNCWNCFGSCGRGGNIIDFVSLREGISFRDAALRLQGWFMPQESSSNVVAELPPSPAPVHPPAPPGKGPPQNTTAASDASDDDEAGENPPLSFQLKSLKYDHPYLAERGLTQATITEYGIGYCARGCLRGHVAIPIRNRDGILTGYIGRWPGEPPEGKEKYKLPKGFRKSLELFNLDRALKADGAQPLVVVKGVFDCLHLVQFGYQRTVAMLGLSLSARQEVLLRNAAGPRGLVFLLPNADDAGRKSAAEAAGRLSRSCLVRVIDVGEHCLQVEQLKAGEAAVLLAP